VSVEVPLKELRGGGSGDEGGRGPLAACHGPFSGGEMRKLEGIPGIYLAEKRMPWGRLKFR
jgi:hypothetical protein